MDTKQLPARHSLRLLPVERTCFPNLEEVTAMAAEVAQQHFPQGEWWVGSDKSHVSLVCVPNQLELGADNGYVMQHLRWWNAKSGSNLDTMR
jgi:hypothetical protein